MQAPRAITLAAIAAAVAGLAASIASAVDDLGPALAFCARTGCDTVRSSAWARPLGVPMSALGVAFFAAMVVLAFVAAPRLRRWGALAGGAWAAWLIGVQAFAIGVWCPLCVVADAAAIAHAALVLAGAGAIRFAWHRAALVATGAAAVVLALAAWVGDPPAVAELPPGTPESVTREQRPGVVTIVEFVDFECPHCRDMQTQLEIALAAAQTPVRVVRKMTPVPGHRGALPAALAWCCADNQGKGEAMARALFAADPSELTPDGCEKIAARVGCDLEQYRRDLPGAIERVRADIADAEAAKIPGLPTMYIGGEVMIGAAPSPAPLIAAIDRASR